MAVSGKDVDFLAGGSRLNTFGPPAKGDATSWVGDLIVEQIRIESTNDIPCTRTLLNGFLSLARPSALRTRAAVALRRAFPSVRRRHTAAFAFPSRISWKILSADSGVIALIFAVADPISFLSHEFGDQRHGAFMAGP
jgi:hypothetical protein